MVVAAAAAAAAAARVPCWQPRKSPRRRGCGCGWRRRLRLIRHKTYVCCWVLLFACLFAQKYRFCNNIQQAYSVHSLAQQGPSRMRAAEVHHGGSRKTSCAVVSQSVVRDR